MREISHEWEETCAVGPHLRDIPRLWGSGHPQVGWVGD